jgi:tetratricopeptide (TPR) repeat protein
MVRFLASAALVLTPLVGSTSAAAQGDLDDASIDEEVSGEAPDEREEEARALFHAAASALADGRYENALDYFRRAHELSGHPELLFNIGVACDHLHRTDEAIASFDAYLAARPDAENRADVEARLTSLRAILAEDDQTEERETTASLGPGPVPWILTVGGGVLAVTGAVFLGYALAEKSTLEDIPRDTVWADVAGRHDSVTALSAAGIVMLGLGAAALTAGLVWLFTGDTADESAVSLIIGPGHVGVRGRL